MINPFTLKELRQMTRAKSIATSLIVFLFSSLAIAYFTPVLGGIKQNTGATMFNFIIALLYAMLCAVLPSVVFARLDKERGGAKEHADFTMLTALPPEQVIDGKLRSAFTLMALFATAALPFGVFAYMMHGISFASIAISLAYIVCCSCVCTHAALATAALKLPRIVRRSLYALLLFAIMLSIGLGMFICSEISVNGSATSILLMLAATVSACLVLRGFAISFIAPSVMERDSQLRVSSLIVAAGWFAYAASGRACFASALEEWCALTCAGAAVLAAHSASQPAGVSRRILAARPANPFKRALAWPFSSGAANGIVFAFILAMLACAVDFGMVEHVVEKPTCDGCGMENVDVHCKYLATAAMMYVFAALLAVRLVWRIFLSRRVTPALVPFFTVVLYVLYLSVPSYLAICTNFDDSRVARLPFYIPGIEDAPLLHLKYAAGALAATTALSLVCAAIRALFARFRK